MRIRSYIIGVVVCLFISFYGVYTDNEEVFALFFLFSVILLMLLFVALGKKLFNYLLRWNKKSEASLENKDTTEPSSTFCTQKTESEEDILPSLDSPQSNENDGILAVDPSKLYDPMLPQAVQIVLEAQSCSLSMLQRRITLGYSRPARIVDQMEELGIVGPYNGAKPRSVLIDSNYWNEMQKHIKYDTHGDVEPNSLSSTTEQTPTESEPPLQSALADKRRSTAVCLAPQIDKLVSTYSSLKSSNTPRKQSRRIYEEMMDYQFLPYQICDCSTFDDLIGYTGFNLNNKKLLLSEIDELNRMIQSSMSLPSVVSTLIPKGLAIDPDKICFEYIQPITMSSLPETHFIYQPRNKDGSKSITPLIIRVSTTFGSSPYKNEARGFLFYSVDGSMSEAHITLFSDDWSFIYSFGVIGRSFVITHIDMQKYLDTTQKPIEIYDYSWDFME